MKPSGRFAGARMDKVALLPDRARNELFSETAAAMKTTPAIAEKDFWVVWVGDQAYTTRGHYLYKGGASH